MITGFNTDIEHGGTTYHVQTEDKGLDSPLILSLVYVGGAIIASKRTHYEDLIESGFDEKVLSERLQRQHKLICAAIRSGRVEELKKMGGEPRGADGRKKGSKKAQPDIVEEPAPAPPPLIFEAEAETVGAPALVAPLDIEIERDAHSWFTSMPQPTAPAPPAPPPAAEEPAVEALYEDAVEILEPEIIIEDEASEELYLTLLDDDGEFRAGQLATIRIHVGRGQYGQRPVAAANITVKVLGTSFRPLIVTTKTDEEGLAVVRALLPRFTSGRAAIIIRAADGEDVAEMRRIIQQA